MITFREAFDAILDRSDLSGTEKLVALGILRHSNDDLAESHPGGVALAHYASVKRRETIADAIKALKAKGVIRNRHVAYNSRVFSIMGDAVVTDAVLAYRASSKPVRSTPKPPDSCTVKPDKVVEPPCTGKPDNTCTVQPDNVELPCPVQPDKVVVSPCTVQPDNTPSLLYGSTGQHMYGSTVQTQAPSLPLREVSEVKRGELALASDLFGGRGPVVGISYPTALMRALEKKSAPVAASALEDAVRAQLKVGVEPQDIEAAMRKAVAYAEDRRETAPSGLLKAAVAFVENTKRFSDERRKADAARLSTARGRSIPNVICEPLQQVAWEY